VGRVATGRSLATEYRKPEGWMEPGAITIPVAFRSR
jgi:hypothetical protein